MLLKYFRWQTSTRFPRAHVAAAVGSRRIDTDLFDLVTEGTVKLLGFTAAFHF